MPSLDQSRSKRSGEFGAVLVFVGLCDRGVGRSALFLNFEVFCVSIWKNRKRKGREEEENIEGEGKEMRGECVLGFSFSPTEEFPVESTFIRRSRDDKARDFFGAGFLDYT